MKLLKTIICLGLLCMTFASSVEAKEHRVKQKPLYMMGVAVSHLDSAVFITDMHLVKDLTVEKKTKFLMDRQLYSMQLRRYLEAEHNGGPYVTAVFFSPSRKKMERRYLSTHKHYVKEKQLHIVLVDQSRFRFKAEQYIEPTLYEGVSPDKKKKGKKKK